ncbi:MAG: NDP-sugar synthase, partial [Candidatus Nanohaloarchaea archaeon]
AMVLAAGEGTRIREVTQGKIPKPMVDLGPGPLLEHTVNELVDFGVDEIVINLHHRGEVIKDYFGDEWRGTPIHYSEEEELLGTAGGVKNVGERFDDAFIVVYGDILTDLDFHEIVDYHRGREGAATIMVYEEEREALSEASIILTDENERVQQFMEKPSQETIEKHMGRDFWTNAGIYVLEPEVLDYMPEGFSDFSHDIFPALLDAEEEIYVFPQPEKTYWHEVGNPERYSKARKDIEKHEIAFNDGESR